MAIERFERITSTVSLLRVPFSGIWTGVYLVQSGGVTCLIDSGVDGSSVDGVIVPALSAAGVPVSGIDYLLCTHCHGDHIGGHARLRELGVRCIGAAASQTEKLSSPLTFSRRIRAAFPEDSPAAPAVLDGVAADRVFTDGESVGTLQVLLTPGHDTECVSFYESSTGALLTGDSVQGTGTDTQGCALVMALPAYRRSLSRLSLVGASVLVPGHSFHPFERMDLRTPVGVLRALSASSAAVDGYERLARSMVSSGRSDLRERALELVKQSGGSVPEKLFLPLHTAKQVFESAKASEF